MTGELSSHSRFNNSLHYWRISILSLKTAIEVRCQFNRFNPWLLTSGTHTAFSRWLRSVTDSRVILSTERCLMTSPTSLCRRVAELLVRELHQPFIYHILPQFVFEINSWKSFRSLSSCTDRSRTMTTGMMEVAMPVVTETNGSTETLKKIKAGTERSSFLDVYTQLKSELLADSKTFEYTPESRAWVEKMLDYNVPGGKLNRGLSVVDSLRILKAGDFTEQDIFLASALGWCIEWLQAYFLVEDDIMDNSVTRRGQPCWYRVPKVGLIAANDGIVLRNHICQILKRHFKGFTYYGDLLDLFNEVEYQTSCGQMLDLITTPEGEVDLSRYIMSTYTKIVQYKTAYYSFYLPVACALLMAGEKDQKVFECAEDILVQMGTYFQVQDDFLDCYGDPEFIGKIGTDIEDTKCSWLVVTALGIANVEQKQRLEENYGKKDLAKVAEVKAVYNELQLKTLFEEYERESYEKLISAIEKQDSLPLQAIFKAFLSKIYKRQK